MNTSFLKTSVRRFAVLTFILFYAHAGKAQTYTVEPIAYNPFPYVGTSSVGMADDGYSGVEAIGFNFNFYGNNYSSLVVGSNGLVSFNVSNAQSYCPWPISAALPNVQSSVRNSILCSWQDLYMGMGGQIRSANYGTAPNRVFVLSFCDMPLYSCTSNRFTGQLVLYESSNVIDVFTSEKQTCSWNGGYAILGIVNAAGTDGLAAPGRNYPTVWTDSSSGWRFKYCTDSLTDTIRGRVYADLNQNCIFDGNDFGLPVSVDATSSCGAVSCDSNGYYTMVVDTGAHNVSQLNFFNGLAPYCPVNNNITVNFPNYNMVQNNVDFADTLTNYCSDVLVQIASTVTRKCSTSVQTVQVNNLMPLSTSALTITVTLPDSVYYVSSTIVPASVVGNVLTFNVAALAPYGNYSFQVSDSISCDKTAGTYITFSVDVDNIGDCDTANNHDSDIHEVVYSYDPNQVTVANDGDYFVFGEQITNSDTLTYQIDFQNTGSSYAEDVAIVDTLPSMLNANSVVQIISSHNFTFHNIDGLLMFNFENIYLPDSNTDEPGSHGFVRFKVVQQPGNPMGTLIPNTAAIYFDLNPPVITNTATDTIGILSVENTPNRLRDVTIYPNPATDQVTVQFNKGTGNEVVSIYNQLGSLVYTTKLSGNKQTFDTKAWAKGMYLIRLSDKGQTVAAKLLVVE